MASDKLYDLALRFRREKLWKKLSDMELFAVRLPDGSTGYVSVTGMAAKHYALILYEGDKGLESMRISTRAAEEDILSDMYYAMFSQECLQCSLESRSFIPDDEYEEACRYAASRKIQFRGSNAFPRFLRFRKGREPWPVDPEGEENLLAALDAACEVSRVLGEKRGKKEELGFLDGDLYNREIPLLTPADGGYSWSKIPLPPADFLEYPAPDMKNDILAAKARRERHFGIFAGDLVCMPVPAEKEGDPVPFIPMLALLVEVQSGISICLGTVLEGENSEDAIFSAFIRDGISKMGHLPAEFWVANDRTELYYSDFCRRTGIRLVRKQQIPELKEAVESMYEYFLSEEDNLDEKM